MPPSTDPAGAAVDACVSHRRLAVNGITLHVAEAGDPSGALVVLLHGFPEFWYSWRHQLPALADAGLHVVAPDLRGYGDSDSPPGSAAYRPDVLLGDIVGLIRAYGRDGAALVGHDWGGTLAWLVAAARPDRVSRLAILNAPHPMVMARALRSPGQMLRSAYIPLLWVPLLPEVLLGARGGAGVRWLLRRAGAHPGTFTDADLRRCAHAFPRPGALRGPLAYYRMLRRREVRRRSALPRVQIPVRILWGERDPALPAALADPGPELVAHREVTVLRDAGHFVHADAPQRVNTLLVDFLRPLRAAGEGGQRT